MYVYETEGVCSTSIEFDLEDNKVTDIKFTGGCHGNLQGISALIEGMTPEEVIKKLQGIKCGKRSTSCCDQLSKAMEALIQENS